jgi:branched-chain amino acid transport system ATP-binding protein
MQRPDILRAVYVKGTATFGGKADRQPSEREPDGGVSERSAILEVRGVAKRFGGVAALHDVDLTLDDGRILGIIGPNGSGKTTLFDIISGYQQPDKGSIVFDGQDVTAWSAEQRARQGLVRRFQDARLFPSMTVSEVLLVALDERLSSRGLVSAAARLPKARRSERVAARRVDALIDQMGLGPYRAKVVRELSTGIRRIVDITWVLATEPKVLLLDEPSSGVAQSEAEALIPLLLRVRRETGCSMLLIEHDIPVISAVADELVAMAAGEVVTRGLAEVVLDDERVVEAFLGTSEAAVRRSGAR